MTTTPPPIRRKTGVDRLGRVFRYDAHARACRTKERKTERIRDRFLAAADRLPPATAQWLADHAKTRVLFDLALMMEGKS